jgi:hypothetical protein
MVVIVALVCLVGGAYAGYRYGAQAVASVALGLRKSVAWIKTKL